MIFVVCDDRARALSYLTLQRHTNPMYHPIITSPEEARQQDPKPTEEDEIVFLGSDLNAWDFFRGFDL